MRRQHAPLCCRHACHFLARPVIDRLDLFCVGRRMRPVVRGAGWIEARQRSGDVAHVNDPIARIEPGVLVDRRGQLPAGNGMLLLCGQRPHTTGNHDLRTLEKGLLEQGLQPWLELFVEVVEEYGACRRDRRDIGCRRLVQLTVATGPDDGLDVDTVATDVGEHIANDAERRDDRDPVRPPRRARQQQGGEHDNKTKHQASRPIIGARRRQELVAASEIPNSNPATDAASPKPVASAIDAATPNPQHRAAAAGSSIGPTAKSVPNAWKLATRASTTSARNTVPYGARAPTARRNAGSNAPTASGRYSTAIPSTMTLLTAAISSNARRSIASTVPN